VKNKQSFLTSELLINFSDLIKNHLAVGHSLIPAELLLKTFHCDCAGDDLTIKKLLHTGTFSDMGNRYHYKQLIEKGWLDVKNSDLDSRVKLVKATDKLFYGVENIKNELIDLYGEEFLVYLGEKLKEKKPNIYLATTSSASTNQQLIGTS